jgi:hypothetical protein
MQARPFMSSGTVASSSPVNAISWHQHGTAKSPDNATAHRLAEPHMGQVQFAKGLELERSIILYDLTSPPGPRPQDQARASVARR